MARYFSLEEANEILNVIRPLVGRILDLRDEVLETSPEAWQAMEKAATNGGGRAASRTEDGFDQIQRLIHHLQETGAQLKDINLGLVDFLGVREGRDVYLCWKFDEDQIRFWHEIDEGYAGRKPI